MKTRAKSVSFGTICKWFKKFDLFTMTDQALWSMYSLDEHRDAHCLNKLVASGYTQSGARRRFNQWVAFNDHMRDVEASAYGDYSNPER